jgi:hypothetical protein
MGRRLKLEVAALWVGLFGATFVLALATGDSAGAGQTIGVIGAVLTPWFIRHRRRRLEAWERASAERLQAMRPCPGCTGHMRREADTCPACRTRSTPWIRQGGHWWMLNRDGNWQRWNEAGERFEPHQAPDAPAAVQDAKL